MLPSCHQSIRGPVPEPPRTKLWVISRGKELQPSKDKGTRTGQQKKVFINTSYNPATSCRNKECNSSEYFLLVLL